MAVNMEAELKQAQQDRDKYARALRAIRARIDGVFDDPDLVSFGPLAFWPNEDITRIIDSVLGDGNATRETT